MKNNFDEINKFKEIELERRRQDLKKSFLDETDNPKHVKKNETKKSVFVSIIYTIAILLALIFLMYSILDSTTKIDQLQQIINSIILFLIIICVTSINKKKRKGIQIITGLLFIFLIGLNGLTMANIINLPKQKAVIDFVNKPLTSAIKWSEENNINYEHNFEYSDTVEKYSIISQSKKENTLVKDIKDIKFVVSNGPNYDKKVILNDMTGWDIDEAIPIIKQNLLKNVTINFEENLNVDKDIITYQSKAGQIKRNDDIIFTVSLGDKNDLKEITIKKLQKKDLFDALLYLNRNGIIYEIKYEFSDKIAKGKVINCSAKPGDKIKPGDKVVLTVSKGKKIIVPELANMPLSEVTNWIILNNLNIEYTDAYNDEVKSGNIISATYKKGDEIEEETTIKIVVSKGKLIMPKFNSLATFKSWANNYKIKYDVKEEFNDTISKGNIIKFSVETGDAIDNEKGITVYISKGKAIKVPDFNGKTKNNIQKECESLGIKCNFSNEYSKKIANNTMISQSIKPGELIAKGDSINFIIATNQKSKVTEKPKTTSTKKTNNKTTSSSNSSTSSTPTVSCKNYTFNLGAGGTGAQTKQIIIGSNPNLKFSWNPVSACSSGDKEPGTVCSSSVSDGATVSSCTTIKITYVN